MPDQNPTIKLGSRGDSVRLAQTLLQCSGFYTARADGEFGPYTHSSTVHFQQTHCGPTGAPLTTDGVIGPSTWWALNNPSGKDQSARTENLAKTHKHKVPAGLPEDRKRVLVTALAELGKKETPDGSNWGPQVRKFLDFLGISANPWCLAFVMWCFFTAFGFLHWGRKFGLVADFWRYSKTKKIAKTLEYRPAPGDIFIMVHSNGTGHTGIILRVSADGKWLNVIEGNSGNAVRIIKRRVGANDHVGYVVALPECRTYEPGLIEGEEGTTTR